MDRYDVQHQLKDFGKDGQEILSSSSLVVVGAGGLGCPVLQSLAGMGVGKIHIIDQDTVELENLHRQHLYAESDVGEAKVDAAAKRLRAMNSEVQIRTSHDRLTQENAVDLLRGSEAIMDCTDNFSTRYIIDLFCAEYSVPMIYAGVRAYEGQVTVYNFNDGPSFHSIFPDRAEVMKNENCKDSGVLPHVANIIASYQVNELVKILLGWDNVLSGRMLMIDVRSNRSQVIDLR